MNLSPETIKLYGADRLSEVTGLSRRTIYRWAANGIPGDGTIRAIRNAVIVRALQQIKPPKAAKRKRAAA